MNHDTHKEFVERQKTLADEAGKAVALSVLNKMDLGEVIANPKKAKARFIATILKESEKPFDETLALGREFFKVKWGANADA